MNIIQLEDSTELSDSKIIKLSKLIRKDNLDYEILNIKYFTKEGFNEIYLEYSLNIPGNDNRVIHYRIITAEGVFCETRKGVQIYGDSDLNSTVNNPDYRSIFISEII